MFKKFTLVGAAFAMGATAMIPATPAMAQRYDGGYSVDRYGNPNQEYRGSNRYQSRNVYQGRNRDYRNYRAAQKCADGDGGTIVGAIAGGLIGHQVAGRGDRTLGAILGGLGGALAGRAIDRSDRPGYCR
jgi:outer membrane lipoprotein SlyB